MLLEERLLVDPVGIALQRERTVVQMRKQPLRNAAVVVDQVALRVAVARKEHLVEIRERELLLADGYGRTLRGRHQFGFPSSGSSILTSLAILVFAQAEKRRLPQNTIARPLGKAHFGDELRLDVVHGRIRDRRR